MSESKLGARFGMRQFHRWEAIGIRIFFAWLIYRVLPLRPFGSGEWFGKNGWFGPAGQLTDTMISGQPKGLANFMDVTFMSSDALQLPLWILCGLALISYMWGRGLLISIPLLFLVTVLGRSLENSQGFVYHGYKLVSLVLLAQTIVVIVHAIHRLRKGKDHRSRYGLNDYLIRFTQAAIIAGYIVAGMSKPVSYTHLTLPTRS